MTVARYPNNTLPPRTLAYLRAGTQVRIDPLPQAGVLKEDLPAAAPRTRASSSLSRVALSRGASRSLSPSITRWVSGGRAAGDIIVACK